MTRRDDDQSPEPEGGKAEARLRQFLGARGLAPDDDEDEDAGQAGLAAGPGEDTGRADPGAGQEPASREDRDEDSGG